MEEVIKYIGENQMLFYVIGVSFVLAIILALAIKLLSHNPELEERLEKENEKDSDQSFLKPFHSPQEEATFNMLVDGTDSKQNAVFEEFELTKEQPEEIKEETSFETKLETLPDNVLEFEVPEEVKVTPVEVHSESFDSGSELDILLNKLEEDIQDRKVDPIQTFEDFQEENAIISYEELLRVSGKESVLSAEEEESQPIIMSIRELEAQKKKEDVVEPTIKEEPVKEEKSKKFKNTDFISPVYGKINSNSLEYPKIPAFKKEEKSVEPIEEKNDTKELLVDAIVNKHENTVEVSDNEFLEELTDEMRRNEEFLQALKEFRENL